MSEQSLKKQVAKGIQWVFVANISNKVLSVLTTVVLARILSPEDFGLFAVAFVLIDGLGLFQSLGLDTALVRIQDREDEAADTAFWMVPVNGLLLMGILFLAAPFYASYTGQPSLEAIIKTLGILFVFTSLNRVPGAILSKRMQFGRKAIADVVAQVVFSSIAIYLALQGKGIWSLVWAYMFKIAVRTTLIWLLSGWRFGGKFSLDLAKEMLTFGGFVLGGDIIGFLRRNLTNLILIKMIGAAAVGYYTIAYGLAFFVTQYISGQIGAVAYPAYSKVRDDTERVIRMFMKVFKYVTVVSIPFMVVAILLATEITTALYGKQWLPVVPILQVLAFAAVVRNIFFSGVPVFMAYGHPKYPFVISCIETALFLSLVVPLSSKMGPLGAAIALAITSALASIATTILLIKVIGMRLKDLFEATKASLIAGAVTACVCVLCVGVVRNVWSDSLVSAPVLLGLLVIAAVSYFITLVKLDRNIFTEIKEAVK